MGDKPIQEQFGETVIEAFASFARADLKKADELAKDEFSHVSEPHLRVALARVFYGVRWIYKLGLALLTHDDERAAHVRAQIVDYASVCEGLLSHCIAHAIKHGHTVGTAYQWNDPDKKTQPINWNPAHPEYAIGQWSLWWLVRIAQEFKIISIDLEQDLQWLRVPRNTIHLRQLSSVGQKAYLSQSRKAFDVAMRVIRQTKTWKRLH